MSITEAAVIDAINELCVNIQQLNVVLAAIIETIDMTDDQRAALQGVCNELGAAFAVLQSQCAPQGQAS